MRRTAALALASIVHFAQAGCAGRPAWPDLPDPPGEEVRSGFGTVAVLAIETPLDADLEPPVHGFCSSTATHALQGGAIGLTVGGALVGGMARGGGGGSGDGAWIFALIFLFVVALALALTVTGVVIGSLYGALDSIGHGEIDRQIASLRKAALETALAGDVARRLGLSADLSAADTILAIGPPSAVLYGPREKDPPLGLAGTLPARLIRARDQRVLWQGAFAFTGAERRFAEWSQDDGAPLRATLAGAAPALAERIREEAFELYGLPERPIR